MSKIKVYGYKKCSTCMKALKFLDSIGVDYRELDITEKAPSQAELKKMLSNYDGEIKKLFNTSGVVYREMKLSEKLSSMSNSEAIKLLSENGKLVKRPFLTTPKSGLVGFKESEWQGLF